MAEQVNWAEVMGFVPVVRKGPIVAVSGVGGRIDLAGNVVNGDAYAQTRMALAKLQRSLESVGSSASEVVHTRLFVRNIEDWPEVGRAHGEVFGASGVAMTMVGADLVDPDMLVEIDAMAWSPDHKVTPGT